MQSARSGYGSTGRSGTRQGKRLSERAKRTEQATTSASQTSFRESFSARFSEMVLINFEADERLLKAITPAGLEPDLYQGAAHISLVAKTVSNLKVKGFQLARPRTFASVGLQLYVREPRQNGYRYGTVFLKHYIQRAFPAWMMRRLTKCSISKMPMKLNTKGAPSNRPPDIEYHWKVGEKWNEIRIRGRSRVKDIREGSKVEFIFRHPDRYVVDKQGVWRAELQTPGWVVWDVAQAKFDCDVKQLFGEKFVKSMSRRPASVFLSRGNEVKLSKPELVVPAN
jgi:hypothetical protein